MNRPIITLSRHIKHRLPDSLYAWLMYLLVRHEFLHLKHPKDYSEKIQWLKVYGKLERYSSYADKYAVRDHVQAKTDETHLIPLIGAWDSFDEIPFDSLPDKFVIKASHGSGYNIIVKDKHDIDLADMKHKITKWMSENYYDVLRETQYKFCTPKIIVEQYMEDEDGDLKDYKFYCFNGKPEILMIVKDRQATPTIDVFDMSWKHLDCKIGSYPNSALPVVKPQQFETMIKMATTLSDEFPVVRVDLYTIDNKVYFGELTFTPSSGFEKFGSKEFEKWLGTKIDLSSCKSSPILPEIEAPTLAPQKA